MALLLRLSNGFFSHLKNVPTILASKAQSCSHHLPLCLAAPQVCWSFSCVRAFTLVLVCGMFFFTWPTHSSHAHLSATFSQQLSLISLPVFSHYHHFNSVHGTQCVLADTFLFVVSFPTRTQGLVQVQGTSLIWFTTVFSGFRTVPGTQQGLNTCLLSDQN